MKVIGLMSGTSADGIDAALAEISGPADQPQIRQLAFITRAWPPAERAAIENLIANRTDTRSLSRANFSLGRQFAAAALAVIDRAGLAPADVALIGSHGQTVWHEVEPGGAVQSTLQLGEAAVIAEETGITTVADFRGADVAADGQGAPLIPIFDRLLLRPEADFAGCRAVQNIGGIGNVTFLPPAGADAPILAFDTGPGNVLIDWAARQASDGALAFDADGRLAGQGRVDFGLVARWLAHPYFQQPPPKSTGRELFSREFAQQCQADARAAGLSPQDFVATVTELTAGSIAQSYRRFAPLPVTDVIVCGGGGHNPHLLARIGAQLQARLGAAVPVRRYADVPGIPGDGDSKEALCFALLAWLAVQGQPGNVPEATGAAGLRVLGKISPGRNFAQLLAGQ